MPQPDDATHCPATQDVPAAHTLPQAPQLVALVLRLVSQPLLELWSQSPKPALQETPQTPPSSTVPSQLLSRPSQISWVEYPGILL